MEIVMTQTETYRGYVLDTCERLYYGKPVYHTWVYDLDTREPVRGMRKWFKTVDEAKEAVDTRIRTIAWRRKRMQQF